MIPKSSLIFIGELCRRRLIHLRDIIIMDKGYYSYQNYLLGVSRYEIVPLIFPKPNFKLKRALNNLSYPIEVFINSKLNQTLKTFSHN